MNRPQSFDEFVGNKEAVNALKVFIVHALQADAPIPHMGFFGPAGNGKTTLAKIVANESVAQYHYINATSISGVEDLRDYVVDAINRSHGCGISRNIAIIDECHKLHHTVQENLLSLTAHPSKFVFMEDGERVEIQLPDMTSFIFTTTNPGSLSDAFISRLRVLYIRPYSLEEKAEIASNHLNIQSDDILNEIARRSHSARDVVKHCKIISEYVSVYSIHDVDIDDVIKIYDDIIKVDEHGLDENAQSLIQTLDELGNASLKTLASSSRMSPNEVENRIEPILLQKKLIKITSKGRTLTQKGKKLLNEESTTQSF